MKALLFAASAALALAAAPASARVLQITITNVGGTDRGDFRFQIDEDRTPDIVLVDQVRYGVGTGSFSPKLPIDYVLANGAVGSTTTAVSFFTTLQQGGLAINATPFGNVRFYNTTLIENASFNTSLPKAQNKAVFRLGTFAVSTTPKNSSPTRPFDNYSITIAAVPEPATWAMLIGGFAAVGAASRRRGRAAAIRA